MNLYKFWERVNWKRIFAVFGITIGLLIIFYFWMLITMWAISWVWQNSLNLLWVFGVFPIWIAFFVLIGKEMARKLEEGRPQ